mgnify:CR=1 FL=1
MTEEVHEIIKRISEYYKKKDRPEAEHVIGYDSAAEGLEPIYFFITDLMSDFGLKTEKIIDNFTSSPGSGHFGELGQRATIMQQQGGKILADINAVLRSVLNLIYDLKDFKMRLQQYNGLKSKDRLIHDAAVLSLKQVWMDKVDILKGNSSIKSMALGQAGFITLIDAFLSVADEKEADKIDLNERVKRILKPRIQEFNIWLAQSENELKKRYELEKNYLRSQVNSLKLYSRWAKPYLKSAQQLEQKESGRSVDLVKTFNTILLELTLFGKSKFDIKSQALAGDLPKRFSEDSFLKKQRNYNVCILVDFYFRGIPQRVSQQQAHYTFGGKTKVTFKAYVLNDDELEKLNKELSKSDLEDVFKLIEGATTDSLGRLQEEIDSFLNEKEIEEAVKEKKKSNEVNPFLALIGKYEKKEKSDEKSEQKIGEKKENKPKPIKKESWIESELIRPLVAKKSSNLAFDLFNTYKKAHGMASYV